jgi:hypothetical protein
MERIEAMKKLHNAGFKTWVSIEPIIDLDSSFDMIRFTLSCCDFYKIGLKSGAKYDSGLLLKFVNDVLFKVRPIPIYFKDSLLKKVGINRELLPENCVTRDFNL